MRIGRTLPPAAAPIYSRDILNGFRGLFSGQRELDRFESELKDYFGVKHCFLFSSGKAALTFTLSTLHEMAPERDKVVMPAYVCYSVPSAVVHAGLKVVPCDLKPGTLEMDIAKLATLLNETTLCVIVPHLFGIPAQMSKVAELCHKKGIIVIEDAAQTLGVNHNGKILGTQGDIGFCSLGRGKSISTVEGGILITGDRSIGRRLRERLRQLDSYTIIEKTTLLLKAFLLFLFSHPNLYWFPKLLPFLRLGETVYDPDFPLKKMSEIQAGLARGWKEKVKRFNSQRKKKTQGYLRRLSNNSLLSFFAEENWTPVCLRFPIFIERLEDKTRILSESETKGLGIMFTYPDSIEGIPELNEPKQPNELNKPKQLNEPNKPNEPNELNKPNEPNELNKPKQLNELNKPKQPNKPNKPKYPEAKRMAEHILTLPIHPLVSKHDMQKIIALLKQTTSHRSAMSCEL